MELVHRAFDVQGADERFEAAVRAGAVVDLVAGAAYGVDGGEGEQLPGGAGVAREMERRAMLGEDPGAVPRDVLLRGLVDMRGFLDVSSLEGAMPDPHF